MYSYPFISKITTDYPNGDRAIDDSMERRFNALDLKTGVFLTSEQSNSLQVAASTGMTVSVQKGGCNIEGAKGFEDTVRSFTLSAAHSSLKRIDRIVARMDTSDSVRSVELYLKEGSPSSTPVAPDIIRESNYYEIVLADILIKANVTEITSADITDQRLNSSLCGMVVPAFPQPLSLDDIHNQIQGFMDEYMAIVEAALDETAAGHLQNQIGTLTDLKTTVKANVVGAINELADKIYPVGSIYMSVNNTSPATLFGGTWAQIKDTFLLSAGDKYSAGSTGGESEHTLTIGEMPNHNHENSINWNKSSTIGTSGSAGLVIGSAQTITRFSIESAGGGQSHNNLPPYLAVYIWKRTA